MRKPWLAVLVGVLCAAMATMCWLESPTSIAQPGTALAQSGQADKTPYYLDGIDIVYIAPNGARYHVTDHCHNTQTAYAVTAREAARLGYTPCGNCDPAPALPLSDKGLWGKGETVVYLVVQDLDYHRSSTCDGIDDQNGKYSPVAATLAEALYLERTPCPKCNPPRKP